MELAPECSACEAVQMARAVSHHYPARRQQALRDGLTALSGVLADPSTDPGAKLTSFYKAPAQRAPYLAEKAEANRLGERFWRQRPLPLDHRHGHYATAGNVLDAGVDPDPGHLWRVFEAAVDEGFDGDDRQAFDSHGRSGKSLLYRIDNAGEPVFDRGLIRAIKYSGNSAVRLLRAAWCLNDRTRAQASRLGLDRLVDTHTCSAGLRLPHIGNRVCEAFDAADFILAKGIASLEALSHTGTGHPALVLC